MSKKRALEATLYLSLLVGSLIFCWKNVEGYWERITSYSISYEPISKKDWPTIVLCLPKLFITGSYSYKGSKWPYVYGTHLEIDSEIDRRQAGRRDSKRVTLQENQSVDTIFGPILHLSVLYQGFSRGYELWQCYKVAFGGH